MIDWVFYALEGQAGFQVWGKGKRETEWRVVNVLVNPWRDLSGRMPFFGGSCICWTPRVVAVGRDFAERLLREQRREPASREHAVCVATGRLRSEARRNDPTVHSYPSASEVLAHELGHTWQARRYGPGYLPLGATFTWWREGTRWYNFFENQASEEGMFGGIVAGSVVKELWEAVEY